MGVKTAASLDPVSIKYADSLYRKLFGNAFE